jgi:hypothetical protein
MEWLVGDEFERILKEAIMGADRTISKKGGWGQPDFQGEKTENLPAYLRLRRLRLF